MYLLYNSSFSEEREGVGAIYQRIITLLAICRKYNFEFIHQKQLLGHNYHNDSNWDDKWDNFFNLKKVCKTINDIDIANSQNNYFHIMNNDHLKYLLENKHKCDLNYFVLPYNIILNNANSFFTLIQNDLIEAYNESNYNKPLIYKNKSVAIHIRVWNDNDTTPYDCFINGTTVYFQFEETDYINLIKKIINLYPNYDIHIFTQTNFNLKFPNIQKKFPNININIDMDTFDTFHHLAKADVFVMGLSSFSILAAIYNKNTVIHTGMWIKALDSWLDFNKL